MWDRKDLKAKGKAAFKANYWKSVLVALLATFLTNAGTTASAKQSMDSAAGNGSGTLTDTQGVIVAAAVLTIAIIAIAVAIAVDIFIINPLKVGCDNFFLCNRRNPATEIDTVAFGFKNNYKNVIKTVFMKDLFIVLWLLLLIIPGIIKEYEYRMVTYILSENPDLDYHDALQQSKDMMHGNKWRAFVLDLSFIGWTFLGLLTFGILNILYVEPYIQATNAELYVALAHPEEEAVVSFEENPAIVFEA